MGLLDGKVAVVTGSGGGIGRAHALALAKEGAALVINDLGGTRDGLGGNHSMADQVVQEIKGMGGKAAANYDSVTTMEGGKKIVQTALNHFGKIDILVNNAGILRDKTLVKMTEDQWDAVIAVHLKGTFACTQPAVQFMRENNISGRIINTSSLAGLLGNFGQANYSAAKAGIAGFTLTVAMETQKHAITCNAIAPLAKTRMTEDLPMFQEGSDALGPEFISPVVVFLASDLASQVTGKIFGVHGKQLFSYQMKTTEGMIQTEGWTPQEIANNLSKILGE